MTPRAEAHAGVPAGLTHRAFPRDFLLGVATAAYQTAGVSREDARDAVKITVTENGAASEDRVSADGSIPDVERAEFVQDHLVAIVYPIDDGVPVGGYFYGSPMDSCEGNWGEDERFGVFCVDTATQVRESRASGLEYTPLIER